MTTRNIGATDIVTALLGDAAILPANVLDIPAPVTPTILSGSIVSTDLVLVLRNGVPVWLPASVVLP